RYVGLQVNKNIYSRFGTLLVPAYTILTQHEIDILNQQNIRVAEEDVEESSISLLVEASIQEIQQMFEHVRRADQIPYNKMKTTIIPMIVQLCNVPELRKVLTSLEQHDEYTYSHSIGVS